MRYFHKHEKTADSFWENLLFFSFFLFNSDHEVSTWMIVYASDLA